MIIKLANASDEAAKAAYSKNFSNGTMSGRAGHYVAKAKIKDLLHRLHTDPKSLTAGETAMITALKAKAKTKAFGRELSRTATGLAKANPKTAIALGSVGLLAASANAIKKSKNKVKSFDKVAEEDWAKLVNQSIAGSKLSNATKLMGSSAANAVKVISATPAKLMENAGNAAAKGIGNLAGRLGKNLVKVKAF